MVKVECDGCKSPYQVDEKRIPLTGLKMRCPKCGTSFLVQKPSAEADVVDLPAAPAPRPGPPQVPKKPAGPPRPAPKAAVVEFSADDTEDADLPAAAPARGPFADLPASVPARGGFTDLPSAAPARGGFSDVVPPARSSAVTAAPSKGFGEIDLAVDLPSPMQTAPPRARMELEAADLPVIHGGGEGFGEIDLPIVHGNTPDLPATRVGGGGFGEIDLPSPASILPSPTAGGAPRAAPAMSGFGEIDLPMTSDLSLPDLAASGLPVSATAGLPAMTAAGLPTAAMGSGLPVLTAAGLPQSAMATGTPVLAGGPALPIHTGQAGPKLGSAGTIVGAELYGDIGVDHPAEHEARGGLETPLPRLDADALDIGDEFSFGEEPLAPRAEPAAYVHRSGAPAILDPNSPPSIAPPSMPSSSMSEAAGGMDIGAIDPGPSGDAVGGEVELGASEGEAGLDAQGPRPIHVLGVPPVVIAPLRSNAKRNALIGVLVAALAGGSLALFPGVGAFGYYIIGDRVNATAHQRALDELKAKVQTGLDGDTAPAASSAIADARAGHDAAVRYRPTAGYAAYVVFARGLRFGRRAEDDAYAKQLLSGLGPPDGDDLVLANAAEDATTAQLARARQTVAGLAQRTQGTPADVDVAVLAGEIELIAKDAPRAIDAWKHAVEVRKSARTVFGLARAKLAGGDTAGAEASAKEALELSKSHVGARILIATIAWPTADREQEALTLLGGVTDDKAVRAMASDAELVDAYTVLGRIHLSRSRMSAAEQAFGAALKIDPQALQALIGAGELFYRAGRYNEALSRFVAGMQADSDSVIAKVGAAKTKLSLEQGKEAEDLLKKLRTDKPKDSLVAYWLGRVEETLGKKKEAEAGYGDAIALGGLNPEVVDAYVALSRLIAAQGRAEDAAAKLAEAVKKFPDSAALDKARGEVALQTGRYEDAKANFEHALERQNDLGTLFDLGIAQRRLRNSKEAGDLFDKVANVDKEFPGLALERGLLFEQMGQSERALEMYNDALRKAPNDLDLKLHVASTQVVSGHAEQAIPLLRDVIKVRAGSAEVSHYLGRALLVSGSNLAEAMRYLKHATELDGNQAQYWLYVGWAANEIGQAGEAEAALKHALELDQGLGDAYWQRGVLLQKGGQTIDALSDLKTALEKSPSRYEAYATMALCYQDQSNWPEAEAAWRKAIAANDGIAEWHYRLGKILFDHGSHPAAVPELEKAIGLADALTSKPVWLFDAHFLAGDSMRSGDRAKAIAHLQKFLELAPRNNAYLPMAEGWLTQLGARPQR